MKNPRHLNRKERAYILEKISELKTYEEEFGKLSKKAEEKLILQIIEKIQAPQDFPL